MSDLPLEGIKVVDLTTSYSAPIGTMQLADFGADVIKIENPKYGDLSRNWNPFYKGQSIHYLYMNRNKKSVALNMKSEEGKKAVYELVKTADIVVENFKPGTAKKLGMDYETLKQIKPDIIMASLSGYGQTGPYAKRGAYSNLAECMSGMVYITGWPDGKPTGSGVAFGDSIAGMFLTQGILYALIYRMKTGKGQYIDVAMTDSLVALMEHTIVQASMLKEEPERLGCRDVSEYPYDLFEAKDGYCQLGNANATDWSPFARAIGRPDLGDKPEYKTAEGRWADIDFLHDVIQKWALTKTRAEIEEAMEAEGQLYAPVYKVSEMMEDPQIKARDMIVDMEYEGMGKYKDKGIPVKMSETPGQIRSMPPHLGENTAEVLKGVGYTDEQISEMVADGVARTYK